MERSPLARPIVGMVTDRRRNAETSSAVAAATGRAARAGVDLIHVRERDLDDRRLLALVEEVQRTIAGTHAKVLVNDRLDIALASGAHGVHLPAHGVRAARVRSLVPERFLVGRSVHSEAEARLAARDGGCDYLIFGSVFESVSKPPGHPVAGLEALARACRAVDLPVLAIGGIGIERVPAVARAGAAGVAAIGLFATGDEQQLIERVRLLRRAFGAG